jgi:hypothetical protein
MVGFLQALLVLADIYFILGERVELKKKKENSPLGGQWCEWNMLTAQYLLSRTYQVVAAAAYDGDG